MTNTPTSPFQDRCWTIFRREDVASGPDIEVHVVGVQEPDGTVQREIVVHQLHDGNPITARQALQLSRALIAAADEIDGRITGTSDNTTPTTNGPQR